MAAGQENIPRVHDSHHLQQQHRQRDSVTSSKSSDASNRRYDRLNRIPVLPSASSQAQVQSLTKKLAALPRALRHGSPVRIERHRKYPHVGQGPPVDEQHSTLLHVNSNHRGLISGHRRSSEQAGSQAPGLAQLNLDLQQTNVDKVRNLRKVELGNVGTQPQGCIREWTDDDTDDSIPELDADDVRLITAQWANVRERRDALRETFQKLGTAKSSLIDIRQRRNHVYDSMRLAVQQLLPEHPHLGVLLSETQKLDLSYQKAEVGLDELVDELREGELKVEFEERRFYTSLLESPPSTESELSRSTSWEALRGIKGERSEDQHPLLEDLRECIMELHIAEEFLEDLEIQKHIIASVGGRKLTDDERSFLDEFETLRHQARGEIEDWKSKANRLKAECEEIKLISKDSALGRRRFDLYNFTLDDIYLEELSMAPDSSETTPKPSQFGLLLSNPMHLLGAPFPQTAEMFLRATCRLPQEFPHRSKLMEAAKKEFGIESLIGSFEDEDKRGYINRWLLHKLRQSPMEAELLLVYLRPMLQVNDLDRWQRDVLFYWSRDNAATSTDIKKFSNETRSDGTQASTMTSMDARRASTDSPSLGASPCSDSSNIIS
ncbi:hypothetical protein JX266_001537 [Neoarthrinium moseri]|uniref:uncharacterized protein n=1 Tax=Neoarthrinium moseri TaxID=1658444 RepID=UPI001FDCA97E|nr:uncharacterized protein JN550_008698 [Neoarthrinium moseri]KAI1853553.1 hypothetical protein JX266_001537 [Neoarthrinium moseri]KAI1864878.1 hypothetical protein JN550_008698 [Neoarthrinium moseri]